MKKYITPEMEISVFDVESVVTQSTPGTTSAFEEAKTTLKNMSDLKHTFTVNLVF